MYVCPEMSNERNGSGCADAGFEASDARTPTVAYGSTLPNESSPVDTPEVKVRPDDHVT